MDPTGPRHYRELAEALADGLADTPDPRRRMVQAGRSWGRRQAAATTAGPSDPIARLVRMLAELDFAPERPTDRRCIGLRHCPFLELALDRPEVTCPLHLGLMQGAMEAWGSSVTVDRVDAFVEPDLCLARLSTNDPS